MVLPVQASSVGRSTTWMVDLLVPGPGRAGPCRVAALTSAFQFGQR